jgi:hypothetical protein
MEDNTSVNVLPLIFVLLLNKHKERTERAMDTATPGTRETLSHLIQLSSRLHDHCPFSPMETVFARVEPHGAVVLFRFTSGEETERFELSGAEVDALVAANRRRKAIVGRYQAARSGNTLSTVPHKKGTG